MRFVTGKEQTRFKKLQQTLKKYPFRGLEGEGFAMSLLAGRKQALEKSRNVGNDDLLSRSKNMF